MSIRTLSILLLIGFLSACGNLRIGTKKIVLKATAVNEEEIPKDIDQRLVHYKTVFSPNEFVYNSVNKDGVGYIDESNPKREFARVRIPIHLVTDNGTIVVACQVYYFKDGQPYSWIHIARSVDNGETWYKQRLLKGGNPNFIYDHRHNRIFSMQGNSYQYSDDEGLTWSKMVVFPLKKDEDWDHFYQSPTVGIQLKNGILATVYEAFIGEGKKITTNVNVVVFSRDYGETWEKTLATPKSIITNESTIAEYAPNQIMINARGGTEASWASKNPGRRVFIPTKKSDSDILKWGGSGWKIHKSDKKLIEPICNASFITVDKGDKKIGLFTNPMIKINPRRNITLQYTTDFVNWTPIKLLTEANRHVYGYSSLCYNNHKLTFVYDDREKGILFCDLTEDVKEILE